MVARTRSLSRRGDTLVEAPLVTILLVAIGLFVFAVGYWMIVSLSLQRATVETAELAATVAPADPINSQAVERLFQMVSNSQDGSAAGSVDAEDAYQLILRRCTIFQEIPGQVDCDTRIEHTHRWAGETALQEMDATRLASSCNACSDRTTFIVVEAGRLVTRQAFLMRLFGDVASVWGGATTSTNLNRVTARHVVPTAVQDDTLTPP